LPDGSHPWSSGRPKCRARRSPVPDPRDNQGKQRAQRTERDQSKQNVFGKKRECAENGDAQKVAAGTGFGISHHRMETISGSIERQPARPESPEKHFDAIEKHQDNRDQTAHRGEDHHASSDNHDR